MRLLIVYGPEGPVAQADGDAAAPPDAARAPEDPRALLVSLLGGAEVLQRVVRIEDQREAQWLRARETAGIAYAG